MRSQSVPRRAGRSHAALLGAGCLTICSQAAAAQGGALLSALTLGNDELEDGGLRLGFVYRELLDTRMYEFTVGLGFGLVQY